MDFARPRSINNPHTVSPSAADIKHTVSGRTKCLHTKKVIPSVAMSTSSLAKFLTMMPDTVSELIPCRLISKPIYAANEPNANAQTAHIVLMLLDIDIPLYNLLT